MNSMRPLSWPAMISFLVAALFLPAVAASAAEYASISKNGATVRSGPAAKDEALWTMSKGYPVQVIARKGKFVQIMDFEGDKGWIAAELLGKEKTLIVKAASANLRTGAGKDYEIVAEAKQGVVFRTIGKEGDWLKVKHADGTAGWVLGKLLWPN